MSGFFDFQMLYDLDNRISGGGLQLAWELVESRFNALIGVLIWLLWDGFGGSFKEGGN